DFLRRRCADLAPPSLLLLAALAALGGRASLSALAAVVGDRETNVRLASVELADRGLIAAQGEGVVLAYAALGTVVRALCDEGAWQRLHRAAVGVLEGRGAGDATLAIAFREGGDPGEAFDRAMRAGLAALARGEARVARRALGEAIAAASTGGGDA